MHQKGVYINVPKSKARSTSDRKAAARTVSSGSKPSLLPKSRNIPEKPLTKEKFSLPHHARWSKRNQNNQAGNMQETKLGIP